MNFTDTTVQLDTDGNINIQKTDYNFNITQKHPKLGVMLVGMGGNNGSTLIAGLLAHSKKLTWNNKSGLQKVNFYGSISQFGSVHIGYDNNNKSYSKYDIKQLMKKTNKPCVFVDTWSMFQELSNMEDIIYTGVGIE